MFEIFKSIEGYSRYQISEKGDLFDSKHERYIKPVFKKGYYALSLVSDTGERKNISRHRLVAMTFIHNDDVINKTHVNHKNGVKGDDHYLNLEWCTPSHNRLHAINNGLATINKSVLITDYCGEEEIFASIKQAASSLNIHYSKLKRLLMDESLIVIGTNTIRLLNSSNNNGKTKVVWRNLITLESGEFESIAEASKFTDVSIHSIHNRLALPQSILHKDGFQFVRKREFEGWVVLGDFDKALAKCSWVKGAELKWLDSGEVISFEKQTDLSKYLNVSMATLSSALAGDNQPIMRKGSRFALIKRKSNDHRWRLINNYLVEYSVNNGFTPVVVTNATTGNKTFYVSASECSKEMAINTTTLNWRLKKPNVIYDNHKFDYLNIGPVYTKCRLKDI